MLCLCSSCLESRLFFIHFSGSDTNNENRLGRCRLSDLYFTQNSQLCLYDSGPVQSKYMLTGISFQKKEKANQKILPVCRTLPGLLALE